jgi:hypothetical protein
VDDGIDAAQSGVKPLAGDQIAGRGFHTGREAARNGSGTKQAAGRHAAGGESIQKVASDEAGAAGDEDH